MGINKVLLHLGLLIRGGITKGLMFHKGSVAFGPALTAAYDLQEQAIYPRIVLDRGLEQLFLDLQKFLSAEKLFHFKWIRRAPDGFYFLDYLLPQNTHGGETLPPEMRLNPEVLQRTIAPARSLIAARLEEYLYDTKIWQKYQWMAQYFNEIAREYPEAGLVEFFK